MKYSTGIQVADVAADKLQDQQEKRSSCERVTKASRLTRTYNLRRRLGVQDVPMELWDHIISYISCPLDLKNTMLACKTFHPIAQQLLWAEPKFKVRLDLKTLQSIAKLDLPIQRMKMSLFTYSALDTDLEKLVDCMNSQFKLNYFYIDTFPINAFDEGLSIKKFEFIMANLPVKKLNTCCFVRQKFCVEFFAYLQELKNCPELELDCRYADSRFNEEERIKLITFVQERFPESYERQFNEDKERTRMGERSHLLGAAWPSYFLMSSDDDSDDSDYYPE